MGSTSPEGHSIGRRVDFWNTNLPEEQHTAECPDFLQYAFQDESDRRVLATLDRLYRPHSWDEVKVLVRTGDLGAFKRRPSDLRRYRLYMAGLAEREGKGGVRAFLLRERLRWTLDDLEGTLGDEGRTFDDEDKYRVLRNDWPYGLDRRIVHLVVWTKFRIPAAPVSPSNPNGDMPAEARAEINRFMDRVFAPLPDRSHLIWFWNWPALKSVHSIEHFHVMLFDPDPAFVDAVTKGDVAVIDKVKEDEREESQPGCRG